MSERRILESWKAIVDYLGYDVKTCRRWSKDLGLPVHRLDESPKARVFAYTDELDRWKEEQLESHTLHLARTRMTTRRHTGIRLIAAAALVVLAVAAAFLVRRSRFADKTAGLQSVKSVAVLPFVDLSPNKEYGFLCDGIVDNLIDALKRIEGLRVPSRTSTSYFEGRNVPVQEIGKKLNVQYILEATVQADGEKLRVIARLLSVADGYQLWSEKYEGRREDIFAVEDGVARMVAENLKVEIKKDPQTPVAARGTADIEAYRLFLLGQRSMERGRQSVPQAISYFEKALEKDPSFAEARALMAHSYFGLGHAGNLPMAEAYPKAKDEALKALAIDPDNATALGALASINLIYDLDFGGAETAIRKAIRRHPDNAHLHGILANILCATGRGVESLQEALLVVELDPLSSGSHVILAMRGHYFSRRHEPALNALKKAIELNPYNEGTQVNLIAVHLALGRFEEARAANQRRREILGCSADPEENDLYFGLIHSCAGEEAEARRHLARVKEIMKTSYVTSATIVAWTYAALGDKDEAFAWLEKAVQDKEGSVYRLKVEPLIDPLRDEPRFDELLHHIGLGK